MTTNDATRATAEGMPEEPRDAWDALSEAESVLLSAKDLSDLMGMAGESLNQPYKNAITAGAYAIRERLQEGIDLLCEARLAVRGGAL